MTRPMRLMWMAWLGVLTLMCPAWVHAQDLQPIPALTAHVIDQTGTLSAEQSQTLEGKLTQLEQSLGSQVVVLLIQTSQPEDIAAYAQRVGDNWKIGRKDVGDGVIVLVAKQDRKVRIEVAKTLEGAIPDLAAKRIIDGVITPAFKAGDFAGGLNAAVDQLASRIKGEALPLPDAKADQHRSSKSFNWEQLIVFGLVAVPLINGLLGTIFGRKGGSAITAFMGSGLVWLITGSILLGIVGWFVVLILSLAFGNSGRGGWGGPPMGGGWGGGGGWSGGSGGGGFSSGGGGDFGGGGASGNW